MSETMDQSISNNNNIHFLRKKVSACADTFSPF